MKRVGELEEQFRKRYNRKVEVYRDIHRGENKKLVNCEVLIKSPKGNEYRIDEYFTDDELTKHVLVTMNNKQYKYNRHLDAEVSVADAIGEE